MADPKTHYATETNVDVLVEGVSSSVSETLMSYALTASDNYIDQEVGTQSKTDTPALVMQAAEYKAGELIYRKLYKNSEGTNPTAVWLAKEAKDLLESFVKGGAEESNSKQFSHTSGTNILTDNRRQSGFRRY
jgi:hypothetical protein